MRPLYADPKTDFVFKRIFGTEAHKPLLIALLNDLLAREATARIKSVSFLREEQRPLIEEMKSTVVDVKCVDESGSIFVVEMQVLNVSHFEKRVVYNASKAYVSQLDAGNEYGELHDVYAVSICNFELWPDKEGEAKVPLVSRWRMRETSNGREGLSQVQYVFVELPKFALTAVPSTPVEEWAYVFRHAATLKAEPTLLHSEATMAALEVAKVSSFSEREWEAYDRFRMAEMTERGRLEFAEAQGIAAGAIRGRIEGKIEGKIETVMLLLRVRGLVASEDEALRIASCTSVEQLERWIERIGSPMSVPTVRALFES